MATNLAIDPALIERALSVSGEKTKNGAVTKARLVAGARAGCPIDAAALHTACRRKGVQVGTIDVLVAQLCVRHRLTMLSTDADFPRTAAIEPFAVWSG